MALAAALAAYAPTASAFTHVVQRGETLASIAERHYGRIQLERLLVAANQLEAHGGSAIVPGMRLEVPAMQHRRVKAGESWTGLAEELLGSKHRADVLAMTNGTSPWLPPADGLEIVVPYNLRVVATPADSIVNIAYRFMGDMNKAWVLDHYNGRKGKAVQPGDVLLVPLTELPLTEEGLATARGAAAARRSEGAGGSRDAQKRVEAELPALLADVRGGRYVDAVTRGARFLASGVLSQPQLARTQRALLEAYVALDAPGLATQACAEWLKHEPTATLDPVHLSPKILSVCEQAKAPR